MTRLDVQDGGAGGTSRSVRRWACSRKWVWIRSQVSSHRQKRQQWYTVCQDGKSWGRSRQVPPLCSTHRIALMISRRSQRQGCPPGLGVGSGVPEWPIRGWSNPCCSILFVSGLPLACRRGPVQMSRCLLLQDGEPSQTAFRFFQSISVRAFRWFITFSRYKMSILVLPHAPLAPPPNTGYLS